MTGLTAAMQAWFESFGWPVYCADDVPVGAQLPYITVPAKDPGWDMKCSYQVQLWAYTKENASLIQQANAICAAVHAGVRIPFQGGVAVLWPDTPLQQVIPNGNVRRVLILLSMNAYHCPGM